MKKLALSALFVLLLASCLAVGGCDYITGAAPVEAPPATPAINNLTPEEAYTFVMSSSFFPIHILDVRTPAEYAAGHITGAINVDLDSPDFKDNIDKLDRSAAYIVYCRSGSRAAAASKIMAENGFQNILCVVGGGFNELTAYGFHVEK